ncbi:MAG: Hint domain-containing protein [Paracoccaceae bacterium]
MSRVSTSFGEVPAQALREHDRVRTKSGEYLEILEINRIKLDEEFLSYHPGAQPILIRAGALAASLPRADVILAPYQQLDKTQPCLLGSGDRAIDTISKPHCMRKSEPIITYTIFHCGQPATVNCEGLWIETAP